MDIDIFEEMHHWLQFIERWKKETDEPIPEKALLALEQAIEKAIINYQNQKIFSDSDSDINQDDTLH